MYTDWKEEDEIANNLKNCLTSRPLTGLALYTVIGHAVYSKSDPRSII
jgi:citrate synthase